MTKGSADVSPDFSSGFRSQSGALSTIYTTATDNITTYTTSVTKHYSTSITAADSTKYYYIYY